jgi:hypothetical protein
MTPYINMTADAKAMSQAYALIKVKTPDAYHKDRSKL